MLSKLVTENYKQILKFLKKTSYSKMMKSSELYKKTNLEYEEFWELLMEMMNDKVIRRINDNSKLIGVSNPTAEYCIENDAHSYYITYTGKQRLKIDYIKPVGVIASLIAAATGIILLL